MLEYRLEIYLKRLHPACREVPACITEHFWIRAGKAIGPVIITG